MKTKKMRDLTLLKEGMVISSLIFSGTAFIRLIIKVSKALNKLDSGTLGGFLNSASVFYNNPIQPIVIDIILGLSLFFMLFFLGLFIIYWMLS